MGMIYIANAVDYPASRKVKIREEMGQTCKACGRRDKFDFHVPDDVWLSIVPESLSGLVVCLSCFDEFASKKGIDYSAHLRALYFVGDREAIELIAIAAPLVK
jgi:hypothetical protein